MFGAWRKGLGQFYWCSVPQGIGLVFNMKTLTLIEPILSQISLNQKQNCTCFGLWLRLRDKELRSVPSCVRALRFRCFCILQHKEKDVGCCRHHRTQQLTRAWCLVSVGVLLPCSFCPIYLDHLFLRVSSSASVLLGHVRYVIIIRRSPQGKLLDCSLRK